MHSPEFIEWARQVATSKRAKKALEFLLERGSVTTGDLQAIGYDHPPRAIRDLKDAGFVITSEMVTVGGRRMSQYTLSDSFGAGFAQRKPIPQVFRNRLFEAHGYRCAVCGGVFIARMLQADHRVPFHVGGDPEILEVKDFMPLCGSDNRAKSMSCETCPNWHTRDIKTCQTCYWHDPENYTHVATVEERRLSITARHGDIAAIDSLRARADAEGVTVGELVLRHIRDL
jgi:Helix-turn-helix domain